MKSFCEEGNIGLLSSINVAIMRMKQVESGGYETGLCETKTANDLTEDPQLPYRVDRYRKLRTGEPRMFDTRKWRKIGCLIETKQSAAPLTSTRCMPRVTWRGLHNVIFHW